VRTQEAHRRVEIRRERAQRIAELRLDERAIRRYLAEEPQLLVLAEQTQPTAAEIVPQATGNPCASKEKRVAQTWSAGGAARLSVPSASVETHG